jgi:hypothetical protein
MVVSDESPLVDERERERGVDVDVMTDEAGQESFL